MPSSSTSLSGSPSMVDCTTSERRVLLGSFLRSAIALAEILVDGGSCLFPDSIRSLEVPRWHVRADGVVAPPEELR